MTEDPAGQRKEFWAVMGLTLVVGALSVSKSSLWIDEAQSAIPAMQDTLNDGWAVIVHGQASEVQMPGYFLLLWAWEKVVGSSEYALRSLNIIFLLLAQAAWLICSLPWRARRLLAVGTLIVPMMWAYMNEARPYMMIFAGACLTMSGLLDAASSEARQARSAYWRHLVGVSLMVGGSGLTLPWATISVLLAWLLLRTNDRQHDWVPLLSAAGVTLAGIAFNLWAVMSGARASAVASTDLRSLAFASLEVSGLSGFLPGRIELRELGLAALSDYWQGLAAAASVVIPILVISVRESLQTAHKRAVVVIGLLSVCSSVGVVLIGVMGGFRVVGRHLIFLVPVICLILALSLTRLRSRHRASFYVLGSALLAIYLTSSLLIRFHPRHAHDDYKRAAKLARAADEQGRVVWWSADPKAALYYGISLRAGATSSTRLVLSPRSQTVQELPAPDVVILSKPDIYDSHGAIRTFLSSYGYSVATTFQAFEIWEK